MSSLTATDPAPASRARPDTSLSARKMLISRSTASIRANPARSASRAAAGSGWEASPSTSVPSIKRPMTAGGAPPRSAADAGDRTVSSMPPAPAASSAMNRRRSRSCVTSPSVWVRTSRGSRSEARPRRRGGSPVPTILGLGPPRARPASSIIRSGRGARADGGRRSPPRTPRRRSRPGRGARVRRVRDTRGRGLRGSPGPAPGRPPAPRHREVGAARRVSYQNIFCQPRSQLVRARYENRGQIVHNAAFGRARDGSREPSRTGSVLRG